MFSCGYGCWSYGRNTVVEGHGDIMGCESVEQEGNGTDLDHGFRRSRRPFVILAVVARATVPRIRAFHDPAFANHAESPACAAPTSEWHCSVPTRLRCGPCP